MIDEVTPTSPLGYGPEPDALTDSTVPFGEDPNKASPGVNATVADARASRYHYAMGPLSPGKQVMQDELVSGLENLTRQKAVDTERAALEHKRQQDLLGFVERAKQDGRAIDSTDYEILNKLSGPVMSHLTLNPDTYFEKKLANKQVTDFVKNPEDQPEVDPTTKFGLENFLANQHSFSKILEDTNSRYEQESSFTKGVSLATTFLPVVSWWTKHNAVKDAPTSSMLEGNNLQEQVQYLLSLPTDEANLKAQAAIDQIYSTSPLDALKFAQALVSYGEGEQATDNALNTFNVASGVTAGTALKLATNLRPIVRAAAGRAATIPSLLDHSGNVADAALRQTMHELSVAGDTTSGARKASVDDLYNSVPTIANPRSVISNAGSTPFSTEFANRLKDLLVNQSEGLLNRTRSILNITRLEPGSNAYNVALQETQDLFNLQYPNIQNGVLSIAPIRSADNVLANTDHIAVQIGRNNGTLFDAYYEAEAIARLNGLKGYTIESRGSKYYIQITKAVDETTPRVRDALRIDTSIETTPRSIASRFIGYFRTKDSLLSTRLNEDVKAATFGAEQFTKLSQAIMDRAFSGLPNKFRNSSRRDFIAFLEHQRDIPNPSTPNHRGTFSGTLGDFVNDWQAFHGRPPTEQEATAYFTYTQVSDAEWVVRNLNIYKGKSRLGLENFDFKVKGANYKSSPTIEGRVRTLDDLFRHDDDAGILVFNESGQGHSYRRKNYMSQADRADVTDMVNNQGYRIVQVSNFGEDELRRIHGSNIPNGRINYVLVKDFSSQPLGLNQIPYRPGGHVVYADNHFISQPVVRPINYRGSVIHDYYGDHNLMAFRTREQATRYNNAMEQARQMLVRGDTQALRNFLNGRANLPFSYQEFTRLFDQARGGIFDRNTPFYARSNGRNVHQEHKLDRLYANFRDPLNTPHNLYNEDVNLQFAMERNEQLNTVVNLGSPTAPVLNMVPSRNLDPTVTLSRSIASAAKGRYYEDLKIKSAERFVQEFGDLLKGNNEELQRFPLKTLMGDNLDRTSPDRTRLAAALNYRRAMRELFNVKDEQYARVNSIINSITESLFRYNIIGETGRRLEAFNRVEPHLAHTIADPTRFFRNLAFYTKLGFFNPKQLFLQGQGVGVTAGIEGVERASKGAALGSLMRGLHLRGNDAILADAAAKAHTLTGINPLHFTESYLALQRTGFQNVGGEFALMDDVLNPSIISSGTHKALDSSLVFFRKGERANRLTAWNAAYLRWREANPLGIFDDRAVKEVLVRADLLTGNMSRASNAGFNSGWAAIPSQFLSYNARLMDLMLGGRLNRKEKARLIGTMSTLYGVPLGVLGTTAGALWPWHEQFKKELIDNGYDVNDTFLKAFSDGLPQAMVHYLSDGKVDPNLAETFGPNGTTIFKDFFLNPSGKAASEIVAGPSGKIAWDLFTNSGPKALSATWDLMKQGYGAYDEPGTYGLLATGDDNMYPVTMDDFMPLLQNLSTASQAVKAYNAFTIGKYFSRNGNTVIDQNLANPWNSLLAGVLGTNPQSVSDYYTTVDLTEGIKDAQKENKAEGIRYLRYALDPDISDADRLMYNKKAALYKKAGGFTDSQWNDIIKEAISNNRGVDGLSRINDRLRQVDTKHMEQYFNKIHGKNE